MPPNVFPDSLSIILYDYIVFERSIDREWHNPSGIFSDGRGDPLK